MHKVLYRGVFKPVFVTFLALVALAPIRAEAACAALSNGVVPLGRFNASGNATVFTESTTTATATVEGAIGYDTAADLVKVCDGTNWQTVGPVNASGTAGYVQISGGSGAFTSDSTASGQLFWDSTNHFLGVGTATPASRIHVSGGEIQTGTSGTACGSGNAGAIRYDTGTMYYCNGLAWLPFKATGAPAGSGYFVWTESQYTGCLGTTITSITGSGTTATLTTTYRHGLSSGDSITVSGATPADYNGTYTITVTGTKTFTYDMSTTPASNATVVGAYCPGSGGLTVANALCLSELTNSTTWWGYTTANAAGILTAGHVKAFLCDGTTCNDLAASKTYYCAKVGDLSAGGASFTTDASGLGPNDSADWSRGDHFATWGSPWMARAMGASTKWGSTSRSENCTGWTTNSSGVTGYVGQGLNGGTARWLAAPWACNAVRYLVCAVDP